MSASVNLVASDSQSQQRRMMSAAYLALRVQFYAPGQRSPSNGWLRVVWLAFSFFSGTVAAFLPFVALLQSGTSTVQATQQLLTNALALATFAGWLYLYVDLRRASPRLGRAFNTLYPSMERIKTLARRYYAFFVLVMFIPDVSFNIYLWFGAGTGAFLKAIWSLSDAEMAVLGVVAVLASLTGAYGWVHVYSTGWIARHALAIRVRAIREKLSLNFGRVDELSSQLCDLEEDRRELDSALSVLESPFLAFIVVLFLTAWTDIVLSDTPPKAGILNSLLALFIAAIWAPVLFASALPYSWQLQLLKQDIAAAYARGAVEQRAMLYAMTMEPSTILGLDRSVRNGMNIVGAVFVLTVYTAWSR